MKSENNLRFYLFFGIVSCATITIELLYPKFLQFLQVFGFETTIIPISMLGLGAGAFYSYYKKELENIMPLSIGFALTIVVSPLLLLYLKTPFFAIVLLGVPFFFSSAIIAIGYANFSSFPVYASISGGGATGVLIAVAFIEKIGVENLLLLLTILIFSSIPLISGFKNYRITVFLTLLFLGLFLVNLNTDAFNIIRLMPHSHKKFANFAGSDRLKERDVELLYSRWSLIARVDLVREKLSIYDSLFGEHIKDFENRDVRDTFMDLKGYNPYYNLYYNNVIFTFIPYKDEIIWKMPPYSLLKNPEVLIIGLGGGVDIAIAKYNNAKRIVGIEINPATVKLMQENEIVPVNTYKDAEIYLMDGRSYIESTDERFDLIQLIFTELYVPFPNSLAFVENYLYTVEAFKSYFRILKDDGLIFINKWLGQYETPSELLRITTTAFEALKRAKVPSPEMNFIIVGYYISGWKTNGGYILIKKNPFSREEIEKVKSTLGEPMFLLYSPQDRELNNPFSAFFKTQDKEGFYKKSPLNIEPTFDDRPYLNQFDKKYSEHRKLLFQLGIISILLIILILRELWKSVSFLSETLTILFTIILIAVAYMWIELVLIQKFNILLGSPVLSMGIVLTTLFFFNGVGSAVSSKLKQKQRIILFLFLPAMFFLFYLLLPEFVPLLFKKSYSARFVSATAIVSIAGFFSGIPFPQILDFAGQRIQKNVIPLLIAFDSVLSVLAVGLLMLLSVIYGFNLLLFISVLFYLISVILLILLLRK